MNWPWESRVKRAEAQANAHELQRRAVERNWPEIHKLAKESKRQRELNGWTSKVLEIFGGQ